MGASRVMRRGSGVVAIGASLYHTGWEPGLAEDRLRGALSSVQFTLHARARGAAPTRRGFLQSELIWLLRSQFQSGRVITECSIDTPKGVKVADVAWCSPEFVAAHGDATPFTKAPEICIEILSPSNTVAEVQDKVLLYLAKGAREVWLVEETGGTVVYRAEGVVPSSAFVGKCGLPCPAPRSRSH